MRNDDESVMALVHEYGRVIAENEHTVTQKIAHGKVLGAVRRIASEIDAIASRLTPHPEAVKLYALAKDLRRTGMTPSGPRSAPSRVPPSESPDNG